MKISVEEKTKVDKVLTITATPEDLEPRFDKALRSYRKKINMPGFRPGQVPVSIIKKRFGKEIESEEINKYIQEVFSQEIVPEHDPVGEPRFEDLKYEDGILEATLQIGVKPQVELVDVATVQIDKMVHDVTDQEVEEEISQSLERAAKWVETDGEADEEARVTVDALPLDKQGNPVEDDLDQGKELDLSDKENEAFLEALKGAVVGDERQITIGEADEAETFRLSVVKVMHRDVPELNEEFVSEATNGQVTSVDEYRSQIRSRIQNYYDQVSSDMARQEVMQKLIEAHGDIPVAEVVVSQFQRAYLDRMKQEQGQGQELPEDFNEQEFLDSVEEDATRDARWAFITAELEKKYTDIEITPEDIDQRLASEAARYGLPAEMVKNFYAQSGDQIENLRRNIRTDKLFDRILNEVSVNELEKEAFQEKKKSERPQEESKEA